MRYKEKLKELAEGTKKVYSKGVEELKNIDKKARKLKKAQKGFGTGYGTSNFKISTKCEI